MEDVAEASRVAERIRLVFAAPFDVQGHDVFTTASIGIALGGPRYDRPEAVLRDADTALHRAKAEGKARHRVFDTPMHVTAVEPLQLEHDLRRARAGRAHALLLLLAPARRRGGGGSRHLARRRDRTAGLTSGLTVHFTLHSR